MLDYPEIDESGYQSIRGKRRLDSSFRPGKFDVICARGKDAYEHEGNQRFRSLIRLHKDEYASVSSCKYLKSKITSKIVATVRSASPEGGFVKRDLDGLWYEVGDRAAKEKVGQSFRDRNPTLYSSSTKAKAKVRQMRRAKGQDLETTMVAPITPSSSSCDQSVPSTVPSSSEQCSVSVVSQDSMDHISGSNNNNNQTPTNDVYDMPTPDAHTSKHISFEIAPEVGHLMDLPVIADERKTVPTTTTSMATIPVPVFGSHQFHPMGSSVPSISLSVFEEEPTLEPIISDDSESNLDSDLVILDDDMKRSFCEVMGVIF